MQISHAVAPPWATAHNFLSLSYNTTSIQKDTAFSEPLHGASCCLFIHTDWQCCGTSYGRCPGPLCLFGFSAPVYQAHNTLTMQIGNAVAPPMAALHRCSNSCTAMYGPCRLAMLSHPPWLLPWAAACCKHWQHETCPGQWLPSLQILPFQTVTSHSLSTQYTTFLSTMQPCRSAMLWHRPWLLPWAAACCTH